jgi:hypothetical protein
MIKYRLRCECGHEFETWFQSGCAYDKLNAAGQLACVICGSAAVEKAMMAPSLVKGVVQNLSERPRGDNAGVATIAAVTKPEMQPQELRSALKALRQEVLASSENVGPRFADEARRIHEDEAPPRSIYGQATREEALDLIADGIAFLPMPPSPDDAN